MLNASSTAFRAHTIKVFCYDSHISLAALPIDLKAQSRIRTQFAYAVRELGRRSRYSCDVQLPTKSGMRLVLFKS